MKPRILIVDDEEMIRSFLSRMLEHNQYECVSAGDGNEALNRLEQDHASRIKIALVDMAMPEMSCHELITRLRESRQDLRIGVVSGYDPDDVRQELNGIEIDGVLKKPFQMAELINFIEAMPMHQEDLSR